MRCSPSSARHGRSVARGAAPRPPGAQPAIRVEALGTWLRERCAKLSPNSQVAKAIAYSLSAWDTLVRFLDDGRLCLSNNAAERALRSIAVDATTGPSPAPTPAAAAIYTLIETAKLNDVDLHAWLADVLARLQDHPAKRIAELLPWNWVAEMERGKVAA